MILGTEYAGEMKKGVFTVMNYLMPETWPALDALLGDGRSARRPFVAAVRAVRHRQDNALGRPQAATADRRRRALLERRRRLQHRRGLLRQGDRPDAREPSPTSSRRCGSAPCWKTWCWTTSSTVSISTTRASRRTRAALIRSTSSACPNSLRGRPSDGRHLPDLRRLWRLAAGQFAVAGAGDVSLHQRLHGQSGRHRGGRDRTAGHVLALLRRTVHGLASDEICRAARRQRCSGTTPASGWSTPAGAAAATAWASGSSWPTRARSSTRSTPAGSPAAKTSAIRSSDSTSSPLSRRSAGILMAPRHLGRPGGLRSGGEEARRLVCRKLQEI